MKFLLSGLLKMLKCELCTIVHCTALDKIVHSYQPHHINISPINFNNIIIK